MHCGTAATGRVGSSRDALLNGVSRTALLALSAALALGVTLPREAQAGPVTVNPVQTSTYYLTTGRNPITFGSETNIVVPGGFAVVGNPAAGWTITNQGSVRGEVGIILPSPSTVTNAGAIIGAGSVGGYGVLLGAGGNVTNQNAGLISGGIGLDAGGTVTNLKGGTISGGFAGVSSSGFLSGVLATVTNAGTISGQFGVALSSAGAVTNQMGGQIIGSTNGVEINLAGTVTNAGSIRSTGGYGAGVLLGAGGTVTNQAVGTISGGSFGVVLGGGGTVTNAGAIAGNLAGVSLGAGGTVTNQAGGTITGARNGVYVTGGSGTVTNAGIITARGFSSNGVELDAGGTVTNTGSILATGTQGEGVWLQAGGTVINQAGGTISGGLFGVSLHAGGSITNAGTISSSNGGVLLDGGNVVNQAHGTISGTYFGVGLGGGSSVTNQAGGRISGDDGVATGTFSPGSLTVGPAATVTNAGAIAGTTFINFPSFAGGDGVFMNGGGTVTNQPGGTITGARFGIYTTGGSGTVTNAGTISGTAGSVAFAGSGANTLTLQTGSVLIGDAIGSTASGANNALVLQGSGVANNNFISFNTLNVQASGAWTLGGDSTIGTTTVQSGTLVVNGILNSSQVTVDAGATLAGTGTIDPTAVTINSGGTLAPGTPGGLGTLTIVGNLAFNAGSFYAVQIAPGVGNYSKTAVIGTADIGGNGTVVVTPQLGKYDTSYQILTATGGIIGSFAGVGINANFIGNMTIGDLDLVVDGVALLTAPSGANQNQQNALKGVNNGIINSAANAVLPPLLQNLGNLSTPALLNSLSQLSGEAATGAEQSAFQLTNEFLNLMLDPFVNGRGYAPGATGGGNALGFAPDEQTSLPSDVALAYASILGKAPAPSHPSPASGGGSGFDQRWSAWGAAFGGSNTTSGDATVGSHDIATGTYGFAAGMDYHVSPSTIVGFALAGAGTNWGLSNGLGGGYSDAFQVGTYGITWFGPAYLAGALSFTNHWFTTNRAALGDQLTADFVGQSYGARFEGGYRFTPSLPSPTSGGWLGWGLGVTPYGALQAQDFRTPSYSETDTTGGALGLSYNAMNATDVRTELGARFDDPTLLYGKPLILFGRLAWAHDFVSNPALSAAFEALPGSTFTVNGAPIPQDSALTTAGAQFFLASNWSLIAKFDGAFAAGSQTYAGSGTLRYSW
jgi:uncharacterized protein with beta-barrel porin domain